MSTNVGTIDRVLRVIVGLGVLSLLFILEGSQKWLGLIGLVPFVTGVFSFCPAYCLIGVNTKGKKCCKGGCKKEKND
ncbi:DUF2892 domain-containing protein [Azospirillaceae bacterium]